MRKQASINRENVLLVGGAIALFSIMIGMNIFGQSPSTVGALDSRGGRGTHSDVVPHAANMQSFGSYHTEAQVNDAGDVQIHFYGTQANQLMAIPTTGTDLMMEAKAIIPGENPIPLTLTPKPYPNEAAGTSSRFVGYFDRRPDQRLVGLTLTLPLDHNTYRVQWTPESLIPGAVGAGHGDTTMPAAATDSEAQKLFLKPGGLYTETDIRANGSQTAADKYRGLMAHHSMNPMKGDHICPITNTVADARFAWIVGGKQYLFCCPPCVEEFVKRAKEKPGSILPPEKYIKN